MKKYKHKKTGYIASFDGRKYNLQRYDGFNPFIPKELIEDSNDWELVKDYTILSFKDKDKDNGYIYMKSNGDWYEYEIGMLTLEQCLNNKKLCIYSVRRESDGEVFTIGDTIINTNLHEAPEVKIDNFFMLNDLIYANEKNGTKCDNLLENIKKVKPKEWEITAFRNKKDSKLAIKQSNDEFSIYINAYDTTSEKSLLSSVDYEIYSVKRLSDSVEFKIGDTVIINGQFQHTIRSFCIIKDFIRFLLITSAYYDTSEGSDIIEKIEKLFTTEDGVDIYEGDMVSCVDSEFNYCGKLNVQPGYFGITKKFSTKKAAQDYIIMNKPCLSLIDVLPYLNSSIHGKTFLKRLVKSKIKS